MSKIFGNMPQTFQMPRESGQTQGKDKSKGSSQSGSAEQSTRSNSGDDLPGVGLSGGPQGDLSQGGFDTNEQSAGVLDVVEERQRRLQEDGIGEKLLGGGGEANANRALQRNLNAGTPTLQRSGSVSSAQSTSPLQNIEALDSRPRARSVSRPSSSLSRQVAQNVDNAEAIGQRKVGPALDDDLPRVGLGKK